MYNLLGKEIRGRFGLPSGIIATNSDTASWVIKNIPQIGFYVGKSTTLQPREGNPEDIIVQPKIDSLRNAVGYTNPGIIETKESFERLAEDTKDVALIPQIGEYSTEGFEECVAEIDKVPIDAIELNLSCPHAQKGGILIGSDPDIAGSMVVAARKRTKKPLIVKLNAGVPDIGSIVRSCESNGANAFSLINTIGGQNPDLSNIIGGLSGATIYPVARDTARYVRSITKKPMIVMGGIRGPEQIRELDSIDPNFFYAIGTALTGLNSKELKAYFWALETDLTIGSTHGSNIAQVLALDKMMMEYSPFIVKDAKKLSNSLSRIRFYENLDAGIGQFVFVKTGKGSKPFSVAHDKEYLELVVRNAGPVSESICSLQPNTTVRIRGPYGSRFNFKDEDKVVFVGAGCGIAPIHHAATHHKGEKLFLLGAKTQDELVYLDEFRELGNPFYATEDGSLGHKGLVTDLLEDMDFSGYKFFNCGPEKALRAIDRIERKYAKQEDIYHLIERMTSCGVGICGKCSTPDGERACVDGPVFSADRFTPGVYTRDKTGGKSYYD